MLDPDGAMVADPIRIATPYPMSPNLFVDVLCDIAEALPPADRATIGMPGMIRHGRVITTPHYITVKGPHSRIDPELRRAWDHYDAQTGLARRLGIPTRVVNDAEVHGAAVVSGGDSRPCSRWVPDWGARCSTTATSRPSLRCRARRCARA